MLTEKDRALGLLQTAVAQLLPQALVSIPSEKLLNQLQEIQEPLQERQQLPYRWASHPSAAPLLRNIQPPVLPGEASGGQRREPGAGQGLGCLSLSWRKRPMLSPGPPPVLPMRLESLLYQTRLQGPAVGMLRG